MGLIIIPLAGSALIGFLGMWGVFYWSLFALIVLVLGITIYDVKFVLPDAEQGAGIGQGIFLAYAAVTATGSCLLYTSDAADE